MRKLKKYLSERFKLILKNLDEYKNSGDPENIHDLRVELKKLKALYRLTGSSADNFPVKKNFSPYRTVFKQAGKIRSIDVALEQLAGFKRYLAPGTLTRMRKKRNRLRSDFQKKIPAKIKSLKRHFKKDEKVINSIPAKIISKYLKKKNARLLKTIKNNLKEEELHDQRKRMKEIIYLSPVSESKSVPVSFYKDLQEKLGKWHDKIVLVEFFTGDKSRKVKSLVNKISSEAKKDLQNVRKTIKAA